MASLWAVGGLIAKCPGVRRAGNRSGPPIAQWWTDQTGDPGNDKGCRVEGFRDTINSRTRQLVNLTSWVTPGYCNGMVRIDRRANRRKLAAWVTDMMDMVGRSFSSTRAEVRAIRTRPAGSSVSDPPRNHANWNRAKIRSITLRMYAAPTATAPPPAATAALIHTGQTNPTRPAARAMQTTVAKNLRGLPVNRTASVTGWIACSTDLTIVRAAPVTAVPHCLAVFLTRPQKDGWVGGLSAEGPSFSVGLAGVAVTRTADIKSGLEINSIRTSRTAARAPSRHASATAALRPSANASIMPSNRSSWSESCFRGGALPLVVLVAVMVGFSKWVEDKGSAWIESFELERYGFSGIRC
jgi:hypothetical protein